MTDNNLVVKCKNVATGQIFTKKFLTEYSCRQFVRKNEYAKPDKRKLILIEYPVFNER